MGRSPSGFDPDRLNWQVHPLRPSGGVSLFPATNASVAA
jgi:hypothetical protein